MHFRVWGELDSVCLYVFLHVSEHMLWGVCEHVVAVPWMDVVVCMECMV